jgi:two-component system cell cycle sensor histidine kinase/response regulator CckA
MAASVGLWRTKSVLGLVGIILVLALSIYLGSSPWWRTQNRVYRIGWQQVSPYQQRAEDGSPSGLAIDLVRDAARRRGIRLIWVWHPGSSEAALRNGDVDLWPLITVTPERKNFIHISRPYLQHYNALLVRADSGYSRVQDLASAKISHLDLPIDQQLLHATLPEARLVARPSLKDAIEEVCTLRADAAFMDEFTASAVLLGGIPCSSQPLRLIPMPMLRTTLGVGSTLAASSVADEIRRGIDDAAHDGDLERILMRWGYSSQQDVVYFSALMDAQRRERWLTITLGVVAFLLAVTLFGTDRIRRQRNVIKTTERALRSSEQKLRLLANNLTEMVLAYDMERRLIFVNPAVERLTGYSMTELQREEFICWVHPEDRSRMLGYWEKLFEGSAYCDEEYRLVTKDGQTKWVTGTWGPILDDRGRQIGVQGSEREITERKLAEERFRQLAENLDQVFWMLDINTNKALYVSPAFEKVWARSPGALYEDRDWLLETVLPEDRDRVAAFLAKITSGPAEECYRIVRPDGTVRWIHARAFVVRNPEGKPYRVAGIMEDITAQRELEEQLSQTNKMEALGRLAGGVAHDFNNLLTVICGYSQMLLETTSTGDAARSRLEQILNAANRASVLTKQLLAFSRRQVVRPRLVNVNHLLTNMKTMLGRIIGEHITIETTLDPELGLIKSDPHQMEQVVMNLAVNARDAMPNGGVFRIETRMADAPRSIAAGIAGVSGKQVQLTISDTGCGMDERIRERAFEPFFTTKGVGRGTGLGLSTVYGIVHQNQGSIYVSSQPDRGTTFELQFPVVAEEETDEMAPSKPARKPDATATILLVEDEPAVRSLVQEMLQQLGYTVLVAPDGYEALKLAEENRAEIHLLLTDVIMPLMNGHELATRLEANRPGTKVLYMSGYTYDVLAFHGIGREIDFIQKPFSAAELAEKLEKVLSAGKSAGV